MIHETYTRVSQKLTTILGSQIQIIGINGHYNQVQNSILAWPLLYKYWNKFNILHRFQFNHKLPDIGSMNKVVFWLTMPLQLYWERCFVSYHENMQTNSHDNGSKGFSLTYNNKSAPSLEENKSIHYNRHFIQNFKVVLILEFDFN